MKFGLKDEAVSQIIAGLKKYPQVNSAKIFGSRAIGNFKYNSDIDIALFGDIDGVTIGRISRSLDILPMPYKFDVIAYETITHPPLKEHIDKFGVELI